MRTSFHAADELTLTELNPPHVTHPPSPDTCRPHESLHEETAYGVGNLYRRSPGPRKKFKDRLRKAKKRQRWRRRAKTERQRHSKTGKMIHKEDIYIYIYIDGDRDRNWQRGRDRQKAETERRV